MDLKNQTERWARVMEAPTYEVSSEGRVRNRNTDKVLKPQNNGKGVQHVSLREGHRTLTRSVAALQKRAFEV